MGVGQALHPVLKYEKLMLMVALFEAQIGCQSDRRPWALE